MISQNSINHIITILKPYKPSKISIFGSYARNDNTPSSDLDILVSFSNSIGLIKLIQLQDKLSDTLGIAVDLVTHNSIKKSRLRTYILKDLITIFNEEGEPYIS